jgi:hypothetical protein
MRLDSIGARVKRRRNWDAAMREMRKDPRTYAKYRAYVRLCEVPGVERFVYCPPLMAVLAAQSKRT